MSLQTADDDPRKYLDPLTLARVNSLELQARLVVEGYLSGMHKSPYHGFSVEFAQHREYVPGDDIKHIDWKVYGRTGRFYLKQYEAETNLVCWILLDISDSMRYGSKGVTKYDYACMAAAGLAYLVLSQADSVGFITSDNQGRKFLKPSSQPSFLKEVVHVMNQGAAREKSRMGELFHDLADRLNRRALIFVLSDMFDEVNEILLGLQHLRHKRHEVILWNVLDAAELTFPFTEPTLFRGLEAPPVWRPARGARGRGSGEQYRALENNLAQACRNQNI